jgi:hypothetical protein
MQFHLFFYLTKFVKVNAVEANVEMIYNFFSTIIMRGKIRFPTPPPHRGCWLVSLELKVKSEKLCHFWGNRTGPVRKRKKRKEKGKIEVKSVK